MSGAEAWIREIVGDTHAGAVTAHWCDVLAHDHPEWAGADPREPWVAHQLTQALVSQPALWPALGFPAPPPVAVSDVPDALLGSVVPFSGVRTRYDAVVIGSGAGGGVAAQELTAAGLSVLVVERGDNPNQAALAREHLRNPRAASGLDVLTGPPIGGNPRVNADGRVVDPSDGAWGNNAMTLGGGTRVYGAQAWRFTPEDFRMASEYGVPEGSALADWPFGYDEMEPFYARAEREWGVSGEAGDAALEGWRSSPFPMPPVRDTRPAAVLRAGASALGWRTLAVPLAINSVAYRGRPACIACAQCPGFACPVNAKAGSQNTVLGTAAATGRLALVADTRAVALHARPDGVVTSVTLVAEGSERVVSADRFVLAAGAIESARLVLASSATGIRNEHDQVGRHLQAHVYAGALGVFDEPLNDMVGPGPRIATHEWRHRVDGIVGGGMLANEFVPTPASALAQLQGAGLIPDRGPEVLSRLAELSPRMQRVVGPVHEVTTAEARVTLDADVTDSLGMPVVRFHGDVHPADVATQRLLNAKAADWLRASGAMTVVPLGERALGAGPSVGQHQAGTMRMGDDPTRSATDPTGRVWGHPNLWVADGSLHVTNGGVNPVLTIIAGAYRVMSHLLRA